MSSRYRRPSTANPTVPPPDGDAPARVVARLEPWKALVAIAVALVGGGVAWATWTTTVAKKADVEAVRADSAAELKQAQATLAAQFAAAQVQVQELRTRLFAMEAQLTDLKHMSDRLLDQMLEVARATGARRLEPEKEP